LPADQIIPLRLRTASLNAALVVHWEIGYRSTMSAVELLRQVKALSERERHKFVLSVLMLEEGAPSHSTTRTRRVKWPDVEARARHIFGERVLPNLVLLEREESPF
jgi:hypothetical protein